MADEEEIQELIEWIESAIPQVQILSDNCDENKKIVDDVQAQITALEGKVEKQIDVSENYPSKLQYQDQEFARNVALLPDRNARPEFSDDAFAVTVTKHTKYKDDITKAQKKVKKLRDEAEEIDGQIAPLHKELRDPIALIKGNTEKAGQDYDGLQDVVDLVQDVFAKMEELSNMWQDRADLSEEYRVALNKVALAYQAEIDFNRSERDRREKIIKDLIKALQDQSVAPVVASSKPPMSPKDSTLSIVAPVSDISDDDEGNAEDIKALKDWISHADTQMKVFDNQISAERPQIQKAEPVLLQVQAQLGASKQVDTTVEHALNHQDQQFQAWLTQAQEKGIADHSDFNADKFAIHASYTDKLDHIDDKEMAMNKAQKVVKKAKALVDQKGPEIKRLETEISKERAAGDLDSLETAVELIQKVFEMKGDFANALKNLRESYEKQTQVGQELNTLRGELTDMKNREKRRRDRLLKKVELRLTNAGVTPTKVPEKPIPVDVLSEADEAKEGTHAADGAKAGEGSGATSKDDELTSTRLSEQAATEYLDEDQKAFLEWIEESNKQLEEVMKELKEVEEKYDGYVVDIKKARAESEQRVKEAQEAEAAVSAQNSEYTNLTKEMDISVVPEGCKKSDWELQQGDDITEYKNNMEQANTDHRGDDEAHQAKMAAAKKIASDLKDTEDKIKANTGNTNLDVLEEQTVLIGEQFEKRQTQVDEANVAVNIAESALASASHQGEIALELTKVYKSELQRRQGILTKLTQAAGEASQKAAVASKYSNSKQVFESGVASYVKGKSSFAQEVKGVEEELVAITSAKMALDAQEDSFIPTDDAAKVHWDLQPFAEESKAKEGEAKLPSLRTQISSKSTEGDKVSSDAKQIMSKTQTDSASIAELEDATKTLAEAIDKMETITADIEGLNQEASELKGVYHRKATHLQNEIKRREAIMGKASKENIPPTGSIAQNSNAKKMLRSDSLAALLASDGEDEVHEDQQSKQEAVPQEVDMLNDSLVSKERPGKKTPETSAGTAANPVTQVPHPQVPGALYTEATTTDAARKATAKRVRRSESLRALLESEAEDSSSHAPPSEMQLSVASGELLSMRDFEDDDQQSVEDQRPNGWMVLPDEDLPDLPPELQEGDNVSIPDPTQQPRSDLPVYLQNMLGSTNLRETPRDPQPWVTRPRNKQNNRDPFKVFIFPETARSHQGNGAADAMWNGSRRQRPASAHVSSDRFQSGRRLRPASAKPRLGTANAPDRPAVVRASKTSRRPQSARPASARLGAPTKLRPQSAKSRVAPGPSPYAEAVRVGAIHQPHPPRKGSAKTGGNRSKRGVQNTKPPWDNMVGSGPHGVVSKPPTRDEGLRASKPLRPSSVRASRPKSASSIRSRKLASSSAPHTTHKPGRQALVSGDGQSAAAQAASKALTTSFHEGVRKLMSLWGLLGYPRDRRLRFVHAHGQVSQENFHLVQTEVETFMKFRELVLDILELIDKREKLFAQIRRDLLDRKDSASNGDFTATVLNFLEVTEHVTDAIEHLKESASWITSFNYHGQDYEKKIMDDAEYLKRYRTQNADPRTSPSQHGHHHHHQGHHAANAHFADDLTVSNASRSHLSEHAPQSHRGTEHSSGVNGRFDEARIHQRSAQDAPWHSSVQSHQHEQRVESLLREQAFSDMESPSKPFQPGGTDMFKNVWGEPTANGNGVFVSEGDDSSDSEPNPLLDEVHTPKNHGTPVRTVGTQESGAPKFLRASPGGWTERAAQRSAWYPDSGASENQSHSPNDRLSPGSPSQAPIRRTNSVHWFDEDDEPEQHDNHGGLKRSGSILRIHTQASESELLDAKDIREEGEKIKKQIKEKKDATAQLERERQLFEQERQALMKEREEIERERARLASEKGRSGSVAFDRAEDPEPSRSSRLGHDEDEAPLKAEPTSSVLHADRGTAAAAASPAPPAAAGQDNDDHHHGDDDESDLGSMASDDLDISWHSSEEEAMDAALERLMSSGDLMADFQDDQDVPLPEVTDENLQRNVEEV